MITARKAYSSTGLASQEPQPGRLPGPDIRLVTGRSSHDIRREPVGTFAAMAGPNAAVGTFAGVRRLRREGSGTFAGDADAQRQGTFADADRVMIITYADGTEPSRAVGLLALERLLRDLGDHDNISKSVLDELFTTGHAVVVVEVGVSLASDAHALLDRLERAA